MPRVVRAKSLSANALRKKKRFDRANALIEKKKKNSMKVEESKDALQGLDGESVLVRSMTHGQYRVAHKETFSKWSDAHLYLAEDYDKEGYRILVALDPETRKVVGVLVSCKVSVHCRVETDLLVKLSCWQDARQIVALEVREDARRRGIARRLLSDLGGKQIVPFFPDARASFYTKCGFVSGNVPVKSEYFEGESDVFTGCLANFDCR